MDQIYNNSQDIPDKQLFQALKEQVHPGLAGKLQRGISQEKAAATYFLQRLYCDSIEDLAFLRFFPQLESLQLRSARLRDLDGLRHTPQLCFLQLELTSPGQLDLRQLARFPQIDDLELTFRENATLDLAFLHHLPLLNSLRIDAAAAPRPLELRNAAAIGSLDKLECLILDHLQISDVSWLRGLRELYEITLERLPLSDLSPLAETGVTELILNDCQIRDLTPLTRLPNLSWLEIKGNPVRDFSPLLKLTKLTHLAAGDGQLSAAEARAWKQRLQGVKHLQIK